MNANERRLTTSVKAASEASRPGAIVPQVDLEQINTGVVMADFLAGFDAGRAVGRLDVVASSWRAGYSAGRLDEAAERDAADEAERSRFLDTCNRDIVRTLTSRPSFADLADLRGEPDRAAAQRAILVERGIA